MTTLYRLILCCCLLTPAIVSADTDQTDPTRYWTAHDGSMRLEIHGDYLPDFGLEVRHAGRVVGEREAFDLRVKAIEPLVLYAPYGNLETVATDTGRLAISTGLSISYGMRTVSLDELTLIPDQRAGHPLLRAVDGQGRVMFTLTHMHILAEHERGLLTVANAEVEASAELAALLGFDALADMSIGLAWLDLTMEIPFGADVSGMGPGCSERPIWPQQGQFEAEVALIAMSNVEYQGAEPGTGRVKIAPSATLKNISLADIPWFPQFSNPVIYPYEPADQHPFLVWNIYKIQDGRIRMLAESGAKHAFLTVNVNCDINCGNSNILWPGCEDTYSAGNNNTSTYQGPKEEIEASLGLWDNCGSFFDPGCSGNQSQWSGQWLNRLLIDPNEFQQPGAQYFIDAWYVIQYDVNIWSTMGFRPISPAPNGTGWVMNPGPFSQGPVIGQWVPENNTDPMADHQVIVVPSATPDEPYPGNMPQGHLRLLVRVEEVDSGIYRYNYAVQNFDFERGVKSFSIPVSDSLTVSETWFGGVGELDDWDVAIGDGKVEFSAPEGESLPWFTLFNFEIEVNAAPVEEQLVLGLADGASVPDAAVETLGPPGTVRMLSLDRSTIDFGDVAVGGTSEVEVAVLENSGDLLVSIAGIDQPVAPFSATGSCPTVSFELLPGDSCTLAYQFAPTTSGAFDQQLEILSDALNGPHEIALSGQAFVRSLEISPDQISFGDVIVGDSATDSIELLNDGEMIVSVGPLEFPAAPFEVDLSDCGGAEFDLGIGESCTLAVDFQPVESGNHADELLIHFNASGSPTGVALTGNGLAHQLTVDPEDVAFGNVVVGQSHTIAVALINDSDLPIAVSSMDLPQDFFDVDFGDCESGTFELAVGGSCTMFVQFEPDALGIFADQIIIHSDVPDSPATIPLTGEGVEPALFEDRFEVIGVFGNWWSVSLRE